MFLRTQLISLQDSPPWVAVINGRDRNIERIGYEAADKLSMARYHAAVVVRNSFTLAAGHRANVPLLESIPGSTRGGVGNDVEFLAKLSNFMRGSEDDVKLQCEEAPRLHIDIGGLNRRPKESLLPGIIRQPLLPFNVLTTMSFAGGGTCSTTRPREEFRYSDHQWSFNPIPPDYRKKFWRAGDGDIFIFKMDDCPEDHLPCVHFSSPTERDHDPTERMIACSDIVGYAPAPLSYSGYAPEPFRL